MREVKAYLCDFKCGYKSQTKKSRMAAHEKRCIKNPENRACPTCLHNKFDYQEHYLGHQMGEAVFTGGEKFYYCDIGIYEQAGEYIFKCASWKPPEQRGKED